MATPREILDPLPEASIVKRDVDWVYLDEEGAKRHPLYGIEGWAVILGVLLVLGVLLGLLGVVIVAFHDVVEGLLTVVLAAPVVGYQYFVATRLWQARESFQRHYLILFAISLVLMIVTFFTDRVEAVSSIPSMVIMGLWLAYVFRSVRINVTTRKRVSPADPLVREVIASKDPRLPMSAKY